MSVYAISKRLEVPYEEAVERTRAALAREGFGILTEIDVKGTIKKKLGEDFRKYVILGACSPPNALRALKAETEIGLFLPCNVIVYERDEGGSTVSAIDPPVAMSMIDNAVLGKISCEVREMLARAIKSL